MSFTALLASTEVALLIFYGIDSHSAVQCGEVKLFAVHCSAVQCSVVQCKVGAGGHGCFGAIREVCCCY